MAISLVRVDDRVIHGQVLTQWTRINPCEGIVVVNDYLAENKELGQVYKNAAPANIKVHIFNFEKALVKVNEAKQSSKNYFLITKSPIELSRLVENGVDFGKEIIYGPSSFRPDTVAVGPNQSLTKGEMDACEVLHSHGINIMFKLTPDKKGFTWSDIRNNYYK